MQYDRGIYAHQAQLYFYFARQQQDKRRHPAKPGMQHAPGMDRLTFYHLLKSKNLTRKNNQTYGLKRQQWLPSLPRDHWFW